MMLLGLLLHTSNSYMRFPIEEIWPFKDPSTHPLFDVITFFIHIFRMPVFYVMAGFFAALLLDKRGGAGLVKNRTIRIAIPFLAGYAIIGPLTRAGFIFAIMANRHSFDMGWNALVSVYSSGDIYIDSTAHLWFLYYLVFFYVITLGLNYTVDKLPVSWRDRCMNGFHRLLESRLRPFYLAIPTTLVLCFMPCGQFHTSVSFVPDVRVILAYFPFFGFGLLLYHKREMLFTLNRHIWSQLILAVLLLPVNFMALSRSFETYPVILFWPLLISALAGALMAWMLVFGFAGLFMRFFDKPNRWVRYIVDASYWFYLIHLPFMIWVPGLLCKLSWPAMLKAPAVLAISIPVMWLSYEFMVRTTWVGQWLNGRRYRHGLPEKDEL